MSDYGRQNIPAAMGRPVYTIIFSSLHSNGFLREIGSASELN
jgi:hypothetical protein